MSDAAQPDLPAAVLRGQRRPRPIWIVPLVVLGLSVWLGVRSCSERGVIVRVLLEEGGQGLKPGDDVRYRGTAVGQVLSIDVDESNGGALVTASLQAGADLLARSGSRFWVVRPEFGLARIGGLETLVGPRYLAVLPGRSPGDEADRNRPRQRYFVGLAEAPAVETRQPGDLEIVLSATQQRGLRRGAPVTYRQVRVGTVLSVGLTSDGGAVEARVHVEQPYAQLIRGGTRFWDVGGVEANLGLGGLKLRADALETVLAGGVALATPPFAGEVVRTGHRFVLEPAPPEGWLSWQPLIAIGSSMLPPGAALPAPLRARATWKNSGLMSLSRQRSREGWVLKVEQGLLGPSDMLAPDERAEPLSAQLEAAGTVVMLSDPLRWEQEGVGEIEAQVPGSAWPARQCRRPAEPEDCLIVGDPTAAPLPVAAGRFSATEGSWVVDRAVPIDDTWHGAAVVARADGTLVGLLLVDNGHGRVALLPESFPQRKPGPPGSGPPK